MKISAKSLLVMLTLGSALLTGCQTQPNTIAFTTPAPTVQFNTANQSALVNVGVQDLRPSREIARYTDLGQVNSINASPEVAYLFQQAMQQNLNSKGFSLVQGAANANVIINVRRFFADVEQGNLRYKISANINLEVIVQGSRGQFTKNLNTSRAYEGAFSAGYPEIAKVLNLAYGEAIQSLYNDNEIANAIHQFQ